MASILSEYISRHMSVLDLKQELKRLRSEYNTITKRPLLIFASDFNKGRMGVDVSLMQDDFYIIQDILRESDEKVIDIYLETPGGSGETAEEIARFLHSKFAEVNFVIAGEAKSAGTILAMCADNLYMCSTGSLGPIDAQIKLGRSVVSAYDYKTWVDDKRNEAAKTGRLNPFDALIVSQITPGELYGVVNSLDFAKDLVKEWLVKYKFKNWTETRSSHTQVTLEYKEQRALEVSEKLCNHMDWHTHGRSLKIEDLEKELLIENIDNIPDLADIVYRIKTVIRLIFDTSTDYKLYFWDDCDLARTANIANTPTNNPTPIKNEQKVEVVEFVVPCPKCGKQHKIQGFVDVTKDQLDRLPIPKDPKIQANGILLCDTPHCGFSIDLKPILNHIENQTKKKICIK